MTGSAAPSIPRVLVRLKLRLMINRIRTTRGGKLNAIAALIMGALVGIGTVAGIVAAAKSSDPRVREGAAVLGACALMLGWMILPIITFGADELLDPARLQLLPLPHRPLLTGLLASAFVGPAPTTALLVVVGAAIAYGGGAGTAITVVAAASLVLFSAASARTATTLLAARITSRRGRDAMVIIVPVVALAAQGLRFVRFSSIDPAVVDSVVAVARWLPPGMAGRALYDARNGTYATAAVEAVAPLLLLPGLLRLWGRALDRSVTTASTASPPARRARHDRAALALLLDRLPFIKPTPVGAVAARELRYANRDPRRKVAVLNSVIVGLGGPVFLAVRASSSNAPGLVLLSTAAAFIALLGAMNQFGFDGAALWIDIAAGNRVRDALIGKNLALTVEIVPVIAISGVALAALTGGWAYLPAALLIGLGGLGSGLAVANVVSVRFPQRLPDTRTPFAGRAAGQGCGTGMVVVACMAVQWVVLTPVGIAAAIVVVQGPAWTFIVGPTVVLYGYALWAAGVGYASRWAFWRQPELLLAVDPRRRDTRA